MCTSIIAQTKEGSCVCVCVSPIGATSFVRLNPV